MSPLAAAFQDLHPVLIDSLGVPRYWPNVWAILQPAGHAINTLKKSLLKVNRFYEHSDGLLGQGKLDEAFADLNLSRIHDVIESYYFALANSETVTPSTEAAWQIALKFTFDILDRLGRSKLSSSEYREFLNRFTETKILDSSLYMGAGYAPPRYRSLPPEVIEFLYEHLNPESARNPFRRGASRWLVYVMFVLLLHQGLRRGEALLLPVDVVRSQFDLGLGRTRYWITVTLNEDDGVANKSRSSEPSIKTPQSVRQIPISESLALIAQNYVDNYRGRPNHPFLLSSQQRKPLSTEEVTKIFQKISTSLPGSLRKLLGEESGKTNVTPHDLRHTCAVVRLNQYLRAGDSMDLACQKLRTFCGWSKDSTEPLRYAAAVFHERLMSSWQSEFDDHCQFVQAIPVKNRPADTYEHPRRTKDSR